MSPIVFEIVGAMVVATILLIGVRTVKRFVESKEDGNKRRRGK